MLLTLFVLLALAAALVYGAVQWVRWATARRVTFSFEERESHMVLKVERLLVGDAAALVSMRALREALRLKIVAGHTRLVVDASGCRIGDPASFWLLVGALGPALLDGGVKMAVVCRGGTNAKKYFEDSGLVDVFGSASRAVAHVRSPDPPRPVFLEPGWVDSLLVAGERRPAVPRRRAAAA